MHSHKIFSDQINPTLNLEHIGNKNHKDRKQKLYFVNNSQCGILKILALRVGVNLIGYAAGGLQSAAPGERADVTSATPE